MVTSTKRGTYSVDDAADRLGVSRSTVYEAIKRGDIPSIKIGKRIVVPITPLEQLIASGEQVNVTT